MIAGAAVTSGVRASAAEMLAERRRAKDEEKAKGESESRRAKRARVSRKYLIETYGCQMNYHDSEQMAGLLEAAGYDRTDDDRDADVVVINTCSVREHAEEKLYTRLGELRVLGEETGREPDGRRGRMRRAAGRRRRCSKRSSSVDVVVGTRADQHAADAGRARPQDATPAAHRHSIAHDDVAFPLGVARRAIRSAPG